MSILGPFWFEYVLVTERCCLCLGVSRGVVLMVVYGDG